MLEQSLNGMRIAILAANKFEQVEMTEPKAALEAAGARTTLFQTGTGKFTECATTIKKGMGFLLISRLIGRTHAISTACCCPEV